MEFLVIIVNTHELWGFELGCNELVMCSLWIIPWIAGTCNASMDFFVIIVNIHGFWAFVMFQWTFLWGLWVFTDCGHLHQDSMDFCCVHYEYSWTTRTCKFQWTIFVIIVNIHGLWVLVWNYSGVVMFSLWVILNYKDL